MHLSLNWLKQYLDLPADLDPKALGLKLTMATVEVEGVEPQGENLKNVVVGKVVSLARHPNADRLNVCKVDVGTEIVEVVCGGSNVRLDMLVAFAKVGAKVKWHGEGDYVVLEKAKVRGIESAGMICAGVELGLQNVFPSKAETEIVDLTTFKYKVGTPLAEALKLDDVIYEIDNKSVTNRPDLWGHYGMAREVAAIYGLKLSAKGACLPGRQGSASGGKNYPDKKIKEGTDFDLSVSVKDEVLCPRYLGVAIKGIKVGPSPEWLQSRLKSIGQKSINNIIDITNYIMFDLGQPLHAFSADKIKDGEIVVRRAEKNEKLVTLDNIERVLTTDDLVIATGDKVVALAGIMGNANSEINDNTETIIIEAANFDAATVRKTATRLGLRTEALMRFEKSLDPNLAEVAITRAVELVLELNKGAEVASKLVDVSNFSQNLGPIDITYDFINSRIGEELPKDTIKKILTSLGFKLKTNKIGLSVMIPTWRATKDISIKEDLIEEITRIYGYDNLVPVMPSINVSYGEQNNLRNLERAIKNILSGAGGANEVYNYSFVDRTFLEKIGQSTADHAQLENPWAENFDLMRKSLIPNLLINAEQNLRYFADLNVYEIGKVFINDAGGPETRLKSGKTLPRQDVMLGGIITAEDLEHSCSKTKGLIAAMFEKLGLDVKFKAFDDGQVWCYPNQTLNIVVEKEVIGYLTNLHPQVAKIMGIKKKIALYELNLNKLNQFYPIVNKYKAIPKYPAIEMDLSIVVSEEKQWKDVEGLVRAVAPGLIKRVKLFDIYKDDKIGVGNKGLALRIVYQADDRTLERDMVIQLQEKIVEQLRTGLGAEIRK